MSAQLRINGSDGYPTISLIIAAEYTFNAHGLDGFGGLCVPKLVMKNFGTVTRPTFCKAGQKHCDKGDKGVTSYLLGSTHSIHHLPPHTPER